MAGTDVLGQRLLELLDPPTLGEPAAADRLGGGVRLLVADDRLRDRDMHRASRASGHRGPPFGVPDTAGAGVAAAGEDAPADVLAIRSRCQRASFASPSGSAVRASKPTRSRAFLVQAWRRETLMARAGA